MKRLILALLACAAALLPRLAVSEQVENLYEFEVPVASQGEEARRAGLTAALEGVLVKLSGMSDVARRGGLGDTLAAPERYVDQFRYVAPPAGGQSLWVRFDGRALQELLRSRGLPVWGATRPAVVAWLALEEQGRRSLLGAGDTQPAISAITAAAARRGLPLRLPLLDLEDRGRIQALDIWGDFVEPVQAASARYRAQAILTGALASAGANQWRARWTLYRDGAVVRRWEPVGTLDQVIAQGVDVTADEMARAFATTADHAADPGQLLLRVDDVRSLDGYERVTSYLRGVAGVTAVQIVEITADAVVLALSLQGSVQGFTQAVSLGDTLAPVQEPQPAAELSYRLLP